MPTRDAAYYRDYRQRRSDPAYTPARYARRATAVRVDRSAYDYERRYGLSRAEYDALLDSQGGLCATCREPETLVRRGKLVPMQVDHDHATGVVRGLLCHRCNRLLASIESAIGRSLLVYAGLA